jgi:multiple antibiotic resistance protein
MGKKGDIFVKKNRKLFILIFAALFSVMNPFGTVPVFVGLTEDNTRLERNKIAFWTALNVLIILVISFFIGKYILLFFGITLNSLKIAGGLIITSSGFSLLTGEFSKHKGMKKVSVKEDVKTRSQISLTPLAMPMIAGPGSMSLLITYNQEFDELHNVLIILGAIVFYSYISNIEKLLLYCKNTWRFGHQCIVKNYWFYCNCNWC